MAANKQEKRKNGKLIGRGIQWTDYTWNPIAGCKHRCRWRMPDGAIAICYAEIVANKFKIAYPGGFETHYWHPERLIDVQSMNRYGVKVFLDSMSDIMGHWVPEDQIKSVLKTCGKVSDVSFQLLTKNAPRLLKFTFPGNVWVGASTPPDFMHGNQLTAHQQVKMLEQTLKTLDQVYVPIRWLSVEPLSWDISKIVNDNPPLQWAVIGAATNGNKVFQPDPEHVSRLLEVFDRQNVPVFFKGNIWGNPAITKWREYFPGYVPSRFMDIPLGKGALPIHGLNQPQQMAMEI